ncbi:MAG: 1-(5-phosphoribosyl)-5-[(5-phosphoribosylamino)methylideneamino]imidazole-4-carboxamide isomerase [Bacteroidales bacterium]|nr:1-(5-phosphoribosyl)-5-[(5-phosphoribosylamino)methylideneamino]imidazole-4-carboxamide isomerase [Bacteroidales bacterium]
MIQIIPAIDLIGGRCVRLVKGDYAQTKVYDASPLDMALRYADCGVRRIHLVDLDGAKASEPRNLRILEEIASRVKIETEWGGGISSEQALSSVLDAGASCAIIGSVAALHPELFAAWLTRFGGEKMILGADVRDGKIAVKGWLEGTQQTIEELTDRFLPDGLKQVIVTDISRDGMLQGPSTALYTRLQAQYPGVDFTVSGGISSMEDIRELDALGLRKVIAGKAIYENRISMEELRVWSQNA